MEEKIFQPKNNTIKYRSNMLVDKNKKGQILVKHGHIAITNYKLGSNSDFEKLLSYYKKTHYKYERIGGFYIPYLKELRIPRGFSIFLLKKFFPDREFLIFNDVSKYDKVEYNLKVPPKSDIQIVAISHMLSAPPYEKNARYTQQLLTMDTGEGKSYSTIAVITFNKARSMITSPTVSIAEQWRDYFYKYTDIPRDKVMIVSGGDMCKKIYKGKTDAWVYIFIMKTLQEYLSSNGPAKTEIMLANTKAKIKVIDEVHRNMKTMISIDTLCNFRMNYYLTASEGRADFGEDKVFTRCFKDVIKSDGLKTKQEAHINVLIKRYKFPIPWQVKKQIIVPRIGLNSNLYEEYLFSAGKEIILKEIEFLLSGIDTANTNNNKILFLTSTINGIEELKKFLEKRYGSSKSITVYHSKLPKKQKENYKDGDIILATDKGTGFGADIPGLQFMINLVTYSNKQGAKQFKGRLRKIPEQEVYYFELVNWDFESTYNQYINRKPHLAANAKNGKIIDMDEKFQRMIE